MSTRRPFSTREKIALGASSAILIAMIVYWGVQIAGVLEMLELAYG